MSELRDWLKNVVNGGSVDGGDGEEGAKQEKDDHQNGESPEELQEVEQEELDEAALRNLRLQRFKSPQQPAPKKAKTAAAAVPPKIKVDTSPASASVKKEAEKRPTAPITTTTTTTLAPGSPSTPTSHQNSSSYGRSPIDMLLTEDHSVWLASEIQYIFRVALDDATQQEHPDWTLLPMCVAELTEDGTSASIENLDQVLVEALIKVQNKTQYLFQCYVRCSQMTEKSLNKPPMRAQALNQINRVVCSYVVLINTIPSFFKISEEDNAAHQHLIDVMNLKPSSELFYMGQPFIAGVIRAAHSSGSDTVAQVFRPIIARLCSKMRAGSIMNPEVGHQYRIISQLLGNPHLGAESHSFPEWNPKGTGRQLENESILGCYFRPSSFHEDPAAGDALFMNPGTKSREELRGNMTLIRSRFTSIHNTLHQLLLGMLKNKQRRASVLEWLGEAVNRNVARSFMRYDSQQVASDGFMLNLSAVMVRLSKPFFGKPAKVDGNYAVTSKRLDFSECTRLNFSAEQLKERQAQLANEKPPSFVTECFWLTARCLGIGFQKAFQHYEQVNRAFNETRHAIRRLKETRHVWAATASAHEKDAALKKFEYRSNLIEKDLLADQAQCRQVDLLAIISDFYDFAALWLSQLPEAQRFALPEWLFEDICNFYQLLGRREPDMFKGCKLQDLITFLTVYTTGPFIHNPYLRSQLCSLLELMIPSRENNISPDVFERNKLATKVLAPALMDVYRDIERTGRAGQYYEKFSIRFTISKVLKYLWSLPVYKSSMVSDIDQNGDKFLQFVTLLSNDAIYLLDESVEKLRQIHEFEDLRGNADRWSRLSPEEQQELGNQYGQRKDSVRSYLLLANATITQFQYLSEAVLEPFMQPELVQRLANFLDYFLMAFAGQKSSQLKVSRPQDYGFDPKRILSTLCHIYVNFAKSDDFLEAVVRDERSYNHKVFVRAAEILRRIEGVPEQTIMMFEVFLTRLEEQAAVADSLEDLLVDPPDHFLDPLLYTLMRDPVKLPVSGVSIDRVTIGRHLLSDPRDPFSNAPCAVEDLVDDVELKAEIDAWIAEKLKAAKK